VSASARRPAGPKAPHAVVVTVSDRSARGQRPDLSGPAAAAALREAGLHVGEVVVVPDGTAPVRQALRQAVAAGADLVVTLGGTGVGPRDRTPEATRAVLDRELPGVAEAIRAAGRASTPTAALSRGVAGVVDHAFVVNLPGAPQAVREGVAVLAPLVAHVLDQLNGGDH
jgi:molybdenum cofactor synthesis domain-containing protein